MTTLPSLDERYRWCIYCSADCWPDREHQRHQDACPVVTGVYPVLDQDRCPAGQLPLCARCDAPFELSDSYALLDLDTGQPAADPARSEVVCLGCAAAVWRDR